MNVEELTCDICEDYPYTTFFNPICLRNQSNGTSTLYTIRWSNVTHIVIYHRIVSIWEEKLADVDICSSEDGSCSRCGSAYFLHKKPAELILSKLPIWPRYVICDNNGVQGNQVKLTVFNEAATLCDMQILGNGLLFFERRHFIIIFFQKRWFSCPSKHMVHQNGQVQQSSTN